MLVIQRDICKEISGSEVALATRRCCNANVFFSYLYKVGLSILFLSAVPETASTPLFRMAVGMPN
jgi:hypothetical protein